MLILRFEIVPINNNCYYVGFNTKTKEHVLVEKSEPVPEDCIALEFEREFQAQEYINANLELANKYKPEEFLVSTEVF